MSHVASRQLSVSTTQDRTSHVAPAFDGGGPAGSTTRGLAQPGTVVTPVTAPAPGDRPAPLPLACRMSHPVSCQLALRRTHLACRSRLRRRRPCRFDNPGLAEPGTVVTPVTAPAPGDRPAPLPLACRMSHPVKLSVSTTQDAPRMSLPPSTAVALAGSTTRGLLNRGLCVMPVTAPAPGDRPAPLPLACRT